MEIIGEEPLLLRAVILAFSVPPNKLPIWSLSDYVKSASGPKPQSFSFKLVMWWSPRQLEVWCECWVWSQMLLCCLIRCLSEKCNHLTHAGYPCMTLTNKTCDLHRSQSVRAATASTPTFRFKAYKDIALYGHLLPLCRWYPLGNHYEISNFIFPVYYIMNP